MLAPSRWCRRHAVSLIAAAVVGASFVYLQTPGYGGYNHGGAWESNTFYGHGWPARAVRRIEYTFADFVSGAGAYPPPWKSGTLYYWELRGILFNGMVGVLLLAAPVFVCEKLRRRGWRFNMRALMLVVAAASVVIVLYRHEWKIAWHINHVLYGYHALDAGLHSAPWNVLAPLAFAVGSMVLVGAWFVLHTTAMVLGHFQARKRRKRSAIADDALSPRR